MRNIIFGKPSFVNVPTSGTLKGRLSFGDILLPMRKIFITMMLLSAPLYPQTFLDFPSGAHSIPTEALKGPVHAVLTIEQRDDYVFDTEVVVYDKKGRVSERLSGEKFSQGKATYKYNSRGQLSRVDAFEPDGEFSGYTSYTYDNKGRLVEEGFYDEKAKGNRTFWTKYSYSSTKKEVEVTWASAFSSLLMRAVLAYDDKGRWISRTMFLGVDDLVKFEYDNDGDFVKEAHDEYGHTFRYKYDTHGNWVERIRDYYQLGDDKSHDRDDDMHYYRIITYYSDGKVK
jgi:YD repeat-containing protein